MVPEIIASQRSACSQQAWKVIHQGRHTTTSQSFSLVSVWSERPPFLFLVLRCYVVGMPSVPGKIHRGQHSLSHSTAMCSVSICAGRVLGSGMFAGKLKCLKLLSFLFLAANFPAYFPNHHLYHLHKVLKWLLICTSFHYLDCQDAHAVSSIKFLRLEYGPHFGMPYGTVPFLNRTIN